MPGSPRGPPPELCSAGRAFAGIPGPGATTLGQPRRRGGGLRRRGEWEEHAGDPRSPGPVMPYRRDARTWAAFGLLLALGLLQGTLGVALPYLREELDLEYAAASLHVSAFAIGGLAAGLSGALVASRIGRRALIVAGAAGTSLAGALLTLASSLEQSLACALLLGLALTFSFIGLWSALSDHHGDRRAVALSEGEVAVSLGTLSLPLAVSLAAATEAGWRAGLVAAASVPLAGAIAVRATGVTEPAAADGNARSGAAAPVRGRLISLLAIIVCVVGMEWTLSTWMISYFDDDVALPREVAVALGSGFYGAMLAGRLIASRLARRRYAGDVFFMALGTALVGIPMLVAVPHAAIAVPASLIAGLGTGALFPLAAALVLEAAGPRSTAGSSATMVAASLGVLLAPLTIGALADALTLRGALACTLLLPLLAALLAVHARRARLRRAALSVDIA